jgi:hypothetical protein
MFLPSQRSLVTTGKHGILMAPINMRPPTVLVPRAPRNFVELLAFLNTKPESEFKALLKQRVLDHPMFQSLFISKNLDIHSFFSDSSKQFLLEYFLRRQANIAFFFRVGLGSAPTVYHGDSLLLQYGNIKYTDKSDYILYPCLGSRLILGQVKKPKFRSKHESPYGGYDNKYSVSSYADNPGNAPEDFYAKYYRLNCTKPLHFMFGVNLSYSAPGVVTALYLVPMGKYTMDKGEGVTIEDYAYFGGTTNATVAVNHMTSSYATADKLPNLKLFAEEMGLGYNDAQGLGQCSSIEIDLLEMTPISASVTLHGKTSDGYDKPGVQVNVHNYRSVADSSTCKLEKSTDSGATYTEVTDYPAWDTYGPGAGFFINTNDHFDVTASIIYNEPTTDSITLTVVLAKSSNWLKLTVSSEGFPKTEYVEKMNLVVSNWSASNPDNAYSGRFYADGTSTWWLDGYDSRVNPIDYRGWAQESQLQKDTVYDENPQSFLDADIITLLTNLGVSKYYLDYYYCFNFALGSNQKNVSVKNNKVCFSGIYNMNIFYDSNPYKDDISWGYTQNLPVWILDADYRGYMQSPDAVTDTSIMWTGAYQGDYGVIYDGQDHNNYINLNPSISLTKSNFVVSLNSSSPDNTGINFSAYQSTQESLYYYSLSSCFMTFGTGSSQHTPVPLRGIPAKEMLALKTKGNKTYNLYNPHGMGQVGTNYIDAYGVLLENLLFQDTCLKCLETDDPNKCYCRG